jgi:hypothetical protein
LLPLRARRIPRGALHCHLGERQAALVIGAGQQALGKGGVRRIEPFFEGLFGQFDDLGQLFVLFGIELFVDRLVE